MVNGLLGVSAALFSTLCWALCSLILKKLGEKLDPIGMTTIKSIVASIILFVIAFFTTNINISSNDLLPVLISAILGISIGDSLFFASLNKLSPLTLSLILFAGPDLFSAIFGIIFLNEIPSAITWIAILLLLFGLSLIIFPIKKEDNEAKTKISGIFLAILSLICTAYSMVLIKPILNNTPVIVVTMYRMIFSAIILLIFAIFSKKITIWKKSLTNKTYNIQLTSTFAFVTIGGFWLSLVAIKHCQLVVASSLMMLEPLFILIFMMIFNKYKPLKKELLGVFLILFAILLIYLC